MAKGSEGGRHAADDRSPDSLIGVLAWPESRKRIELGTIATTKAVPDSHAAEKKLLFVAGALVPGIEPADPVIEARSAAYVVSLSRRSPITMTGIRLDVAH